MAYQLKLSDLPPEPTGYQLKLSDLPPVPQQSTLSKIANSPDIRAINNLGGGIAQGIEGLGTGIENIAGNAANLVPGIKNVPGAQAAITALRGARPVKAPFETPNSLPAEIGNFTGQLASSLTLPEAKIADDLPMASQGVKNVINRLATNAPQGAIYSNPNQREQGALTGAIGGEILHHGLSTIANAPAIVKNLARLHTNNYLKKIAADAANHVGLLRTPAEVAALNPQLGTMPVNFGEIINNPAMAKKLYTQAAIPLSGQRKSGAKLVGQAHKYANDLTKELQQGTHAADLPSTIQNAVRQNALNHTAASQALYAARDDLADAHGVQVPLNNFTKAAKIIQKEAGKTWLKTPETQYANNLINQLKEKFKPLPQEKSTVIDPISNRPYELAAPVTPKLQVPFKEAHFASSALKNDMRNYAKQQNFHGKKLMGNLSSALDSDIDTAAQQVPGLKEMHNTAQKYFKNNVIPYRNPPIQKIVDEKSNLSTLNSTLTNSAHAKILEDLSPENKKLILVNMLAKKMKPTPQNALKTTPQLLSSAHAAISPEVRSRLIRPDTENKFGKLNALNEVSKEAQARYAPPNTGFQVAQLAKKAGEVLAAGGALKLLGATKMAALGLPALALERARLATKFSPELRRAYAEGGYKMLPLRSAPPNKLIRKGAILALNKSIQNGSPQ